MPPRAHREPEPAAGSGLVPFAEGDFHALSPGCARDAQFDDRRLESKRKLLALGKEAARRAGGEGLVLEARTSLHHPSSFNQMQVRRMWTYLCRGKDEKRRLRGVIGAELAKDLDAAYRNAYLCAAIESDALEVSLRIHADAWYDGQNLVNRVRAEGLEGWRDRLNALQGFRLRLADWKGEWSCGSLSRDALEEFLKYYRPGEHALAVERRWPAPPGARGGALGSGMPEELLGEATRLLPLYRFAAWSGESDFLFRR